MVNTIDTSIGVLALTTLTKLYDRIQKYRTNALDDEDPEHIHQIRVHLRKLRAAIALFETAIILSKGITDKKIGNIAKDFGRKRDNDVLLERLNEVTSGVSNDNTLIKKVKGEIEKIGKKASRSVIHHLSSKKFDHLLDDLRSWVKARQLTINGAMVSEANAITLLKNSITEVQTHQGWEVLMNIDLNSQIETVFNEPGDIIHDLRKKVKRLRYQIEFLKDVDSESLNHRLASLKSVQDSLGMVQDLRVLKLFLDKTLGDNWREEIPSVFHNLLELIRQNVSEAKKFNIIRSFETS